MTDAKMRVAVLDDYQKAAAALADWESLAPRADVAFFHDTITDEGALVERLRPFDALVIMRERTPFPRWLIEKLPNLKLLVTTGMRNQSVDVQAAADRGVVVCGTESLSHPTVELTWALILAAARKLRQEGEAIRAGRWQTTLGTSLKGATLGVLGLGRLGTAVGKIGQAFGMTLIAWSPNLTEEKAAEAGARRVEKDELFRQSDFLSVHLVLGPRSTGIVGAPELALMKPTAFLINTSRAPIVQEAPLVEALRQRRIAGFAVDVFPEEPAPASQPLLALDNVTATPHLGYVSEDNLRAMYRQAVEDITAFLDGAPVRTIGPPKG